MIGKVVIALLSGIILLKGQIIAQKEDNIYLLQTESGIYPIYLNEII